MVSIFAVEMVMVVIVAIVIWMKLVVMVVMVMVVMVATCKRREEVSSLQKSKDSTASKSLKGVEKVSKGGWTHLSNRSTSGKPLV